MKESNNKSYITSHTFSKVLYKCKHSKCKYKLFLRKYILYLFVLFVYLTVLLYKSWCGAEWEDQGLTSTKCLLNISL